MIAILLFIAACGLTLFVLKKKRTLHEQGKDKGINYHFLKSSLEFLVPFTFVMLSYAALLAVVSLAWESISLQSLVRLEEYLETIHSYTKLKPSKAEVFGLFVGIYLLGLLRIVILDKRKQLYKATDTIYRWSKRVYVVFVLLCSFTLFGTQLGEPANGLRLRIKLTRDGYAEVYKQTQEAISEEVARQLYTKARDSFSPAHQTALKLPEKIGSEANSLGGYYAKAQKEYGVTSSKAESALSAIEAHRKAAFNLKTEIQIPKDRPGESTYVAEPDPRQTTYRQIKEAKTAIENYRQSTRTKLITFLTTEDGKALTIQGAKVMTDILKSDLFSAWIKAYPIAEPILDVFIKTIDETVKAKLEKIADNATRSIIQSPDKTQTTVNNEASKLTAQTEIVISPSIVEKASQSAKQLEQELANLEAARAEIDNGLNQAKAEIINRAKEAENSKIEKLIAQLQSSDKSVRESAAKNLSDNGDKISETKVNELVNIMRHGNKEWITSRYRPPGHHCTDYEYTPTKYYAATALARMRSQYVSDEIAREARKCQSGSVRTKRVTDPGWI